MEIVENGILLKSTDRIDMTVVPERYVLDDDGKLQYTTNSVVTSYPAPEHNYCYINSDNDVLITIDDTDKMYDYSGCLYPEGVVDSTQVALFNHDQIVRIDHMGLIDDEEVAFKEKLAEVLEAELNNPEE